jgi:hypothetical protein
VHLHPLTILPDDAVFQDHWISLYLAKGELDSFFRLFPLKTATRPANALYQTLTALIPDDFSFSVNDEEGNPRVLNYSQVHAIRDGSKDVETVLKAELNGWDTFFVSQKGAYSTSDLITRAENLLPESAQPYLSAEALIDIREAGRCLAFNLGTAAAFHIVRVTETFIWKYYEAVIGALPPTKTRNWGSYSRNLRKCGTVDSKIVGWLDHIRDEYRNPVLHPEESVTPEGALEFLNACSSLIMMIVRDLQKRAAQSVGKEAALAALGEVEPSFAEVLGMLTPPAPEA